MNVAFVENAEYDVYDDNGGENEKRFACERGTKFRRRARERSCNRVRQTDFALRFLNRRNRVTERAAAAQIERDRCRRKLSLVQNRERRVAYVHRGECAQRHWLAAARSHINFVEQIGRFAEVRFHFENDAELVELREDDRHLPLAKSVVERVVDRLGEHIEARRFLTINIDIELQAVHLLIACHVIELRQLPKLLHELRRPLCELSRVRVLQNVLELRSAD